MFSVRSRPAEANALGLQLEAARQEPGDWLDLTVSNPTAVGLPYPYAAVQAALHEGAAHAYEPDARGLGATRQAIAAAFGGDAQRLLLTASTSEAYALLFKLLGDAGDEVLVPAPGYPLLEFLAAAEGLRAVSYPLRYDGRWHLDATALRAALTPRSRAIVVVHPHNPTGAYLKHDELEALRATGLPIIADEVFAAYPAHADAARVGSLAASCSQGLCFSLQGLSKHLGMPQLKLAWIGVGGEPRWVEPALQRLSLLADHYLSAATPVQQALPRLLEAGGSVRAAIQRRLQVNAAALAAALPSDAPLDVLHREGGWVAVLHVPQVHSETEWVQAMMARRVLVQPGYFFDFPQPAYLVLSLLTPPDMFLEGVQRVVDEVTKVCQA